VTGGGHLPVNVAGRPETKPTGGAAFPRRLGAPCFGTNSVSRNRFSDPAFPMPASCPSERDRPGAPQRWGRADRSRGRRGRQFRDRIFFPQPRAPMGHGERR
jgi:hypothetical protein